MKKKEVLDLILRKDINSLEKIIYLYLLHEGKTVKELCQVFNVSESTIKRALANLKKVGLIEKKISIQRNV